MAYDDANMSEKRVFIRHPSDIPIEVYLADVAASKREYLNNIGQGGLSFRSKVPVEPGAIIHVEIPLTNPIFRATGTVVWCKTGEESFDIGVEFTDIESEFRLRMVEQVCHIEHYKREILEKEGRLLSGEEAATEWIRKYAKDFPRLAS